MTTPTEFELAYHHKVEDIEAAFEATYPDMHLREQLLHLANALGAFEDTEILAGIDPVNASVIPARSVSKAVVAQNADLGFGFLIAVAQLNGVKSQLEAGSLTEAEAIATLDTL